MNIARFSTIRLITLLFLAPVLAAIAATQTNYGGSNATGLLKLTATVNALQIARADASNVDKIAARPRLLLATPFGSLPEFPKVVPPHALRPAKRPSSAFSQAQTHASGLFSTESVNIAPVVNLTLVTGGGVSFNGLTQADQRDANHGNQFTIEPPNPAIAVANGYVLEGVNNAIQVYDTLGNPLLPTAIASNELFGLAPAYDRTTLVYGPYPTDMRVFFDRDIQRWIVLQRAQDNDMFGNELASSHLYMAVSETADPTGNYHVYTADTTDLNNPHCPCLDDYPQVGADRYGFYISSNEFNSDSQEFGNSNILAISKQSLGSGASTPTAFRFILPLVTGYEFALQPATTPPGASYLLANSGVEYFASTVYDSAGDSVAVWAMSNTNSLDSATPSPNLVQTAVTTLSYNMPNAASQPNGDRPYGMTNYPEAPLPLLDGGDTRVLSLAYSGARLYLTFATSALDLNNLNVVGGALVILSPTLRGGVLNANVVRQSYLVVPGNNLLRASIAVNADGVGDIAGTVVGPHIFPSAAFVPVSALATPQYVYIAGPGTSPEDGFTGYPPYGDIARWGDFSTAVAASDGSVWLASEYIGDLPRTTAANWDTLITSSKP